MRSALIAGSFQPAPTCLQLMDADRACYGYATFGCTSRRQRMVPDKIEREILIEAPVEVAWAVVTEPEHISGWFSDSVELDLRPGGKMTLRWDGSHTVEGRVERVEPPHFFSFRWVVGPGEGLAEGNSTLVEFALAAEGDGTRLTVVESGFADLAGADAETRATYDDHRGGWKQELGQLVDYAARRPAGR